MPAPKRTPMGTKLTSATFLICIMLILTTIIAPSCTSNISNSVPKEVKVEEIRGFNDYPYTSITLQVILRPNPNTYPQKLYYVELFYEGESLGIQGAGWDRLPSGDLFKSYPTIAFQWSIPQTHKLYQYISNIIITNEQKPASQRVTINWSKLLKVQITRQP